MDYASAIYRNAPNATYSSIELYEFALEGKYEGDFPSFLQRLLEAGWGDFPADQAIPLGPDTPLTRVVSFRSDPRSFRYLFELEDGRVVGLPLALLKDGRGATILSRMQALCG